MVPPPNPRPVAPPTSVARSLANAAAALRAQEWRDSNKRKPPISISDAIERNTYANPLNRTRQQMPREVENDAPSLDGHYNYEENSRAAFYEELRERHRNLTQRQKIAREFYSQQLQQRQQPAKTANGYTPVTQEPAKRQRTATTMQHFRQEPQVAKLFTTSSFSILPRVDISNAMRFRESEDRSVVTKRVTLAEMQKANSLGSKFTSSRATPAIQVPRLSSSEEKRNIPSVIEDPDECVEDDTSQTKQKKRVRYLRDTDRRNIIKRIENGEKQAALAREFGVTRAAICHIKKNRFEILSRYNMLVKSAHEMNRTEDFVGPPGVEMMVHQVRANSVLLLMTMLRDNRSNGVTFRRVAGRLIMILLEEALAILGTESVEVITGTGYLYRGLEMRYQFCGVAIGAEGFPFLVLFHQMEPDAPQGSIHVEAETDRSGQRIWRLDHVDLPANIVQHKVLLFSSACGTGNAESKAIEALCSIGCAERSISLVVILSSSDGIVNISNRFPQVKIITGGIDGKVDPQTDSIIPGFGDFVSRYNNS